MAKDPTKPDEEEIIRQLHQYVFEQLEAGGSRLELERDLVEKGLTQPTAEEIIRQIG
ncbi:hypothetical protein [Zavarzinella formosa]|uniref:hypothetical protein n=1 Tax=Zavarzinella formosa TaxID=360055 RepID=UPI0002D3BABC|nr:hypothetical protein [Zavarzinella formosa]